MGRAHLIADNLIASGAIQKCVLVMPYGHPIPPSYHDRPGEYIPNNADLYEQDVTTDLLPFLDNKFRLQKNAANRSIAGLSMGGGHAIDTGLKNTDTFSAIGAFSAAAPQLETSELLKKYPALATQPPPANQLRHFWIPIGNDDFLLEQNNKFTAQLRDAGVTHKYMKNTGGHEWRLWRQYLATFLQISVSAD